MPLDKSQLLERLKNDRELSVRFKAFHGTARYAFGETVLALAIEDGAITEAPDAGEFAINIAVPAEVWELMQQPHPPVGATCLTMATALGATIEGDWATVVAPYNGAWNRIIRLAMDTASGRTETAVDRDPFADTDNAVGRYVRYTVDGLEHRVYYETAGRGEIPVLFMHTAGADSRQYRHALADPELQERYTLIAVDLPYHGKSVPPIGSRWWEEDLKFDKHQLMNWIVGFIKAAKIDRPIFVGCSVGGQLASDLCAHHPDAIRGAVGINGLYHMDAFADFDNDRFRDPRVAAGAVGSTMFDVTGLDAPEAFRREVEWIYTSNHRDVYPADNDYFMYGHDLRVDGHLIDTRKTPLTIITGEHDLSMLAPDAAGAAIVENIPGAQFTVMPGLSHFTPSDDPVGFRPYLIEALAGIVAQIEINEREAVNS